MTTLRDAFPRMVAIVGPGDETAGERDFSWAAPESVWALMTLVTTLQNGASGDLAAVDQISLAVYDDLCEQRGSVEGAAQRLLVDFVQFWLAVGPLATAARRRQFPMARDWAYRALTDNYQRDHLGDTIHIERLPAFMGVPEGSIANQVELTVLEYADSLFYVARVTADLLDLTGALLPGMAELIGRRVADSITSGSFEDWTLDAALSLLAWLDRFDDPMASPLARVLSPVEDDDRYPEEQRLRIALRLSDNPGRHTDFGPRERARRSLDRYQHRLVGQERLGLLGAAHGENAEEVVAHIAEFLAAIDAYNAFLADQGASLVDCLYDRGRLFARYVGGVTRTLLLADEVGVACRLLGRWQGIEDVREDLVFLLAADPAGTRWLAPGLRQEGSTDVATLGEFIAAANRTLGLSITYSDAGEAGAPAAIDRPGVPEPAEADSYLRACEEHLGAGGLNDVVAAGVSGGVVVLPGVPLPVCALARRATGVSWPLAASLRSPLPDRAIRSVAIWATDAAMVDQEVDAVASLFGAAEIAVEVIRTEQTAGRFRDLYARDDVDVIWLTCHGEQALYQPERSRLSLGDAELTLEELSQLPAPTGPGRRLLVLNACDSATAAYLGGPADFGIGALLASPSQAVVGHLWPVGFMEAGGFGAVMAKALAGGASYLDSFGSALAALRGGPQGMLDALAGTAVAGDLPKRLERALNREFDVLSWGSPTFLE